jgi:hypothetical protein
MQKILRELSCDTVIVSLLTLPFDKGVNMDQLRDDRFKALRELLDLMYRLLKQMAKENYINSRRMLTDLPVFRYVRKRACSLPTEL